MRVELKEKTAPFAGEGDKGCATRPLSKNRGASFLKKPRREKGLRRRK